MSGRRETFDQSAARSFARLPGWDLVTVGMQDLAEGKVTVETELMRSASRRLHELGFDVPPAEGESARLYELVAAEVGEAHAHSTYNALRRRLVSFLRAASRASGG